MVLRFGLLSRTSHRGLPSHPDMFVHIRRSSVLSYESADGVLSNRKLFLTGAANLLDGTIVWTINGIHVQSEGMKHFTFSCKKLKKLPKLSMFKALFITRRLLSHQLLY